MNFCEKHNCMQCCIEADVPLLRKDIDLLTQRGYYDVYFADDYNGAKVLRRVGGRCVFFENGQCEVYDIRPTRCRMHYVSYDNNIKTTTRLDSCVYKSQIQLSPEDRFTMEEYIKVLIKEIEKRINYNPQGAALGRTNSKLVVIR